MQQMEDDDDDEGEGEDQKELLVLNDQWRLPTGCCAVLTNRPIDENVTGTLENKLAPVNSAGYEVHQDVSTSRNT